MSVLSTEQKYLLHAALFNPDNKKKKCLSRFWTANKFNSYKEDVDPISHLLGMSVKTSQTQEKIAL